MVLVWIVAALVILALIWYLVITKLKKSKEIATITPKTRKYICMYCGDEFNESVCPRCGRDTKVPL
ncbi:MAG: hypothetical protein ACE5J2_05285 [Nitrososphaerales archaeon]